MTTRPKVFCVGFQKTGTTTMGEALTVLGYRVTGPDYARDPAIAAKLERVTVRLSHEFDAFQDDPWPLVYREMDRLHPGSKFILTVRDPHKWYASYLNHFGGTERTAMHKMLYGPAAIDDPEHYIGRLLRHVQEVGEYFRDRPQDLLVIDVTREPSWKPLCAFLDLPVPDVPFPHSNHRKLGFLPTRVRDPLKAGWRRLRRLSAFFKHSAKNRGDPCG